MWGPPEYTSMWYTCEGIETNYTYTVYITHSIHYTQYTLHTVYITHSIHYTQYTLHTVYICISQDTIIAAVKLQRLAADQLIHQMLYYLVKMTVLHMIDIHTMLPSLLFTDKGGGSWTY